jgi:hypothetical protein
MKRSDGRPAALGNPKLLVKNNREGKGIRDSPNSRAAGHEGEGCRKTKGGRVGPLSASDVSPPRIGRQPLRAAAIRHPRPKPESLNFLYS